MPKNIYIPADVPQKKQEDYKKQYATITKATHNLFLFAYDQKLEHLNDDFVGSHVAPAAQDPEHAFQIAAQGRIGAFATHTGLIAQYGRAYPDIPYIAKLNGKTNIIPARYQDPISEQLWHIEDVCALKENYGISICGVGFTVYLGSSYEHTMLKHAAHVVTDAHAVGLPAILWVYPRGHSVTNPAAPHYAADATGTALSLGADFVKIKPPQTPAGVTDVDALETASIAAGPIGVICSGGTKKATNDLIEHVYNQLHSGKTAGCAIGRNIFQRSKAKAIALTKALSKLVYDNGTQTQATDIVHADANNKKTG